MSLENLRVQEEERPDWLVRLLIWLVEHIGQGVLLIWSLLAVLLLSLAYGLASLVRGLDLSLVSTLALLAGGVGWYLGRPQLSSRRSRVVALLSGFGLGIALLYIRLGLLARPLFDLARGLDEMLRGFLAWPLFTPLPPDSPLARQALYEITASLDALTDRMIVWLQSMQTTGHALYDPAAITLVWGAAIWGVSLWAGWALRRQQPLISALPPIGLLAMVLSYSHNEPGLLLPMLAATLLLLALTRYRAMEAFWDRMHIDFSEEIRFELAIAIVLLALGVTALGSLSPALTLEKWNALMDRLRPQEALVPSPVAGALGVEQRPRSENQPALENRRGGGLPRDHLLGSGPELSQNVVLRVSTGDLPPGSYGASLGPPPRYYWRALTYDLYTGRGWSSSRLTTEKYAPGQFRLSAETALVANTGGIKLVRQQVEVVGRPEAAGDLVFAAGEILDADREMEMAWRRLPPESGESGSQLDFDLFGATLPDSTYAARSLYSQPGEWDLRRAGTAYPQWVLDRYLALPEAVPNRVLSLARDLTATRSTPFDRAKAIESYLRQIPYTLDLPAPPATRDVVDYFLFDLRQGYCDYDATAMVVLARAAGLPARMAMGYASGTYDPYQALYIVTEADAHSWPEVYFPGYGWVPFEPTGGQPALERVEGRDTAALQPAEGTQATRPKVSAPWLFPLAALVAGLLLLAGAAVLLNWGVETYRLRRLAPQAALNSLYARLHQHSQRLGAPHQPGDTPFEFVANFTRWLKSRLNRSRSSTRIAPRIEPAAAEAEQLTGLYTHAQYSPHPATPADQRTALRLWQRLRWRLVLARLLKR